MALTWTPDKPMDLRTPVKHYSNEKMLKMLDGCGLDVKCHQLVDILPYPRIPYICRML